MLDLLAALSRDLSAVSDWLLQAGIAPASSPQPSRTGAEARNAVLDHIHELRALMPSLIEEAIRERIDHSSYLVGSATPKRATCSRAPQDFAIDARGRLQPLRWLIGEPTAEPDLQALSWLRHLIELLDGRFMRASAKIREHLDDLLAHLPAEAAPAARDIVPREDRGAEFRRHQKLALEGLATQFLAAEQDLRHCHAATASAASWRLSASSRRPWPMPQGPAWRRVAALADRIEHPRLELPSRLRALLQQPTELADAPFLYQRWCSLQVLRTLGELGWSPQQDAIPILFLGGRLDFVAGSGKQTATEPPLSVWIEPCIPPAQDRDAPHESGLCTTDKGIATPDVVLVFRSARGPIAYVLDPTFNLTPSTEKGRYRHRLAFHRFRLVAGSPTRLPPARAFAAQPLARSTCVLHDPEGHTGVVPLHPLRREFDGLRAWLADLLEIG